MTKTCIICGVDCTDKPRIKDSKGNYACKSCAEAKKAGANKKPAAAKAAQSQAPRAAAASTADLMSEWISGSDEGKIAMGELQQPACPKCEHPMMPGNVICMGCGFNTASGKKLRTQIKKADKDPKKKSGEGVSLNIFAMGPLAAFGVMFAVNALPGLLIFGNVSMFTIAVVVSMIAGLILTVSTIIVAFQEDQAIWGWAIIANIIPVVNIFASIPTLIYTLILCPRPGYREAWWGQLLGTVTMVMIAVTNGVFAAEALSAG